MTAPTDTPARLVSAATLLFAARGYEGVSIAAIADELGVTKQALLHHFRTKEKLYAAVLAALAERLSARLDGVTDIADAFERFTNYASHHPHDMALIARELLDNPARAETARQWFLRPFLEQLVALAQTARPALNQAQALAEIYALIGAVNYHAVSGPTLRQIFGPAVSAELDQVYPTTLRDMIASRFPSLHR